MKMSRGGILPPLTETKAKHYPNDASVEFEGLIDGKHKQAIQEATDALVAEARPVTIQFWSREQCTANGVALPEKIEGDVFRVVDIEGCGAYACGGTHVKDTKGVKGIIVRKITRAKGQTRVSYAVSEE
jgi:Ser-tRNA(Ala) deacylase AlaX